jgi:hypothetical protein
MCEDHSWEQGVTLMRHRKECLPVNQVISKNIMAVILGNASPNQTKQLNYIPTHAPFPFLIRIQYLKGRKRGLGYGSGVKHLPHICKALGSITLPPTNKGKKRERKIKL